jgi:protein arginine kinase
MSDSSLFSDRSGWFSDAGPESDVVLSSRVRLSRNLSGHFFPSVMGADEEHHVQYEVLDAFSADESLHDDYSIVYLKDLSPTERRMLLEENIISQDYSMKPEKALILKADRRAGLLINEVDHLRFASIRGGLALDEAYEDVDDFESRMEKGLDFAVSLDWGYLNTELSNIGTGLRASVMLHLPAVEILSLSEKVMKTVMESGFSVKGFFSDDENSMGSIYQISNQVGIGLSEREIMKSLEDTILKVVQYERKAREELIARQRVDIEDRVFRAYGILKYCRAISTKEAIELIASLRLGASGGLLDLPIERITALMFLVQKSHIQKVIGGEEDGADERLINFTRAKVIQEVING